MSSDIFVLVNSPEHLKRFQSHLDSLHINISFTIENQKDNRLSFRDVNIIREQGKFTTVSTANQLLAEFILILTVSYHPPTKLA